LAVAQVAGIMAAKNTSNIIPMCHPIFISGCDIEFSMNFDDNSIKIKSTVKNTGQTGVEMEALTAVSAAALTIYDMCKAIDRGMVVKDIMLMKKSGGKSGVFERKIK
jgi:Molybdenum cofactor biosynthesis enzyme